GKRNLMAMPAPAVGLGNRHRGAVEGQIVFPRALLIGDQFYSDLILLDRAGVQHPNHRAARLFVSALHPDHVSDLQFVVDTRDQSTLRTDVLSASMLGKGPSLGAHSPDPHRQVHTQARFAWMIGHALSSSRSCVFALAMIPPFGCTAILQSAFLQ